MVGRREAATGGPRAKREQLAGATGLGERRAGAAGTREVRRGQTRGGKQLTGGVTSTQHRPVDLHPGPSSRPCTRLLLSKERIPQGPGLFLVARTGRCSWHLGGRSQRCGWTSCSEQAGSTAKMLTAQSVQKPCQSESGKWTRLMHHATKKVCCSPRTDEDGVLWSWAARRWLGLTRGLNCRDGWERDRGVETRFERSGDNQAVSSYDLA